MMRIARVRQRQVKLIFIFYGHDVEQETWPSNTLT